MDLPDGQITHLTRNRIRIRIPKKKGDTSYFQTLSKKLDSELKDMEVNVSSVTGSLVVRGPSLNPDRLFALAESKGLFARAVCPTRKRSKNGSLVPALATQIVSRINTGLRTITGNHLDMPSTAFVLLVAHACREIVKGNLTTPSWFTALWMATTIYSRNLKGTCLDSDDVSDGEADG